MLRKIADAEKKTKRLQEELKKVSNPLIEFVEFSTLSRNYDLSLRRINAKANSK